MGNYVVNPLNFGQRVALALANVVQQKKQTMSYEMQFGEKTSTAKSGLGWMDGRRMHFAAAPGVDPLLLALAVLEESVYVYECWLLRGQFVCVRGARFLLANARN